MSDTGYVESPHLEAFLGQDMKGKCGTCRFFDAWEPPTWNDGRVEIYKRDSDHLFPLLACIEWTGSCHRHPPSVIGENEEDIGNAEFPTVEFSDWCGEHQAKND